jgi:geranylgeranylglycerol-phosphate geranylgeranyltransferase
MNRIASVIKLTRIEHSAMLMVAVIAAELISGGLPPIPILAISLITPAFISMASFAINDYFDIGADTINKRRGRPLVAGALSRNGALAISALSFLIGVLASYFINIYAFVIAVVFGLLAFLYSYKLKDTLLIGNACIAFSSAIPFVYGNLVVSSNLSASILLISAISFLSSLAREFNHAARDFKGDVRARGTKNVVYYLGVKAVNYAALFLYLSAISISIFMFFFEKPFAHNLAYIVPILVVDIMLLYVSLGHVLIKKKDFFGLSRNMSLVAMSLALFTYLLSSIVYIAV